MEELKKLYEERKFAGLLKLCQELEAKGEKSYELYAYYAYAEAARNNLSRLSLEHGTVLYGQAKELCAGDTAKEQELFRTFTKKVLEAADRAEEMLAEISLTPEITQSYRDCMRLSADALLAACQTAPEGLEAKTLLKVKKAAAGYMVQLCAVRRYEVDMGKNILKKVDNTAEPIRQKYVALYDQLMEEVRQLEPDYEPAGIQRERVNPAPVKEEEKDANGEAKKKGIVDKLLDFF